MASEINKIIEQLVVKANSLAARGLEPKTAYLGYRQMRIITKKDTILKKTIIGLDIIPVKKVNHIGVA